MLSGWAGPALARDTLGIFGGWGAFRDDGLSGGGTRCFAIARPSESNRKAQKPAFAAIGVWPDRGVRGRLYIRLGRERARNATVTMTLGGRRFRLAGGRATLYAADREMDRAIIAAMRSATSFSIETLARDGRPLVEAYDLKGAPTAIDAARVGCLPKPD